jgi:conjugal transfer/entry exclusion protein
MKRVLRRIVTAAVLLAALGAAAPAGAQFSSDAALITQLIIQEQQAVSQLKMILQSLQGQSQLLSQFLRGQPQGELTLVASLLEGTQASYANLLGNLQTIGYTITAVNAAYGNTFPNTDSFQAMPSTQFPTTDSGWQNEILASSEIAARSQSSLADTQTLTEAATQILQATGSSDSEVGQLQLILQMLGVVQSQMTMLVQNLTTTGRALVETGAATASERQLSTEQKRRNRLNYTSRGNPVSVPNSMP